MSSLAPAASLRDVLNLVIQRRKFWMTTTAVCGGAAMIVALLTPRTWQATQALVVRQEAASSRTAQPGKFSDLYEMRTLQETILEIARSRQVVAATLQSVDAAESGAPALPPSESAIEQFRRRLDMLPPGGAEFGKTEVFYFGVKANNRQRAAALVDELCTQLEKRMRILLSERAEGLAVEVRKQVETAEESLAEQTSRLREFEMKIGPDLGELRMLHSALSGQSEVRQLVISLEDEARRYQTQASDAQRLLELLHAAQKNPNELVAMPNSLLVTQPALQQLKSGLVRVQLNTAHIRGTRSDFHPRVVASLESEASIRRDLHRELASAIESAQAEMTLAQQRYEATKERLRQVDGRLKRLAESRVEYSNRVAAVDNSRGAVDAARQQLASAHAAHAAAASASLVTRLDKPEVGAHPLGPGRTTVTAAGMCGGFLLGMGICFWQFGAPARTTGLPGVTSVAGAVAPIAVPARPAHDAGQLKASEEGASLREWWHDVPPEGETPQPVPPADSPETSVTHRGTDSFSEAHAETEGDLPVAQSPVVESPTALSPAAQSPVVESPVVESPAVESPAVESPVAESPAVESSAVESSAVESSAVESPVALSPVALSPVVESPVVESPVVESPVVESPAVESPAVESPAVESPAVELPVAESPVAESPAVESPAVESPAVESPVAESPAVESPVVESSVVTMPAGESSLGAPPIRESSMRDSWVLGSSTRDSSVRNSSVRDSSVRDSSVWRSIEGQASSSKPKVAETVDFADYLAARGDQASLQASPTADASEVASTNAPPSSATSARQTLSDADRATLQLKEVELLREVAGSPRRTSMIAQDDTDEEAVRQAGTKKSPRLPSKSSVGDFAGMTLQQARELDAEAVR